MSGCLRNLTCVRGSGKHVVPDAQSEEGHLMKNRFLFLVVTATLVVAGCGGGGSGSDCNVAAGSFCQAGEYCAYLNNSCGRDGSSGTCVAVPASCEADALPVCTCDSLTFTNECLASQSGQSVQAAGQCA